MKKLLASTLLILSFNSFAETTWYSDGSYSESRSNPDGSSTTWNSDGSFSSSR